MPPYCVAHDQRKRESARKKFTPNKSKLHCWELRTNNTRKYLFDQFVLPVFCSFDELNSRSVAMATCNSQKEKPNKQLTQRADIFLSELANKTNISFMFNDIKEETSDNKLKLCFIRFSRSLSNKPKMLLSHLSLIKSTRKISSASFVVCECRQ